MKNSDDYNCEGGPAFPANGHLGMTLRDWFAGQIAASALSSATGLGVISDEERAEAFAAVATLSYEMADALNVERAKVQP